jgi:hypothetical protein
MPMPLLNWLPEPPKPGTRTMMFDASPLSK